MSYVYDLLINLNENKAYEFYEWENSDEIIYLKRIPIFKVRDKDITNFNKYNIEIEETWLQKIYNRSQTNEDKINYICLFVSDNDALVIEFNKKGRSIYRSKLLIDDQLNVLEYSYALKKIKINYKVLDELIAYSNIRQIQKVLNILQREINSLYIDKNKAKLKYLYKEATGNESNSLKILNEELHNFINSDFNHKHLKLLEIIKLSYNNLST